MMSIEAQLIWQETHVWCPILRHDTIGAIGATVEIDQNLHNFGVKLGASLSRSGGEEAEEEIHREIEG